MRVLVTGAGSAVKAQLAADGHEVAGVGRDIARASSALPDVRWNGLASGQA